MISGDPVASTSTAPQVQRPVCVINFIYELVWGDRPETEPTACGLGHDRISDNAIVLSRYCMMTMLEKPITSVTRGTVQSLPRTS
jgi:hypothetical protein